MSMKDHIIVVGSIAFDNIETIKEKQDNLLGGSAIYFSIAASLFSKVHIVGVVGGDFDNRYINLLNQKGINTRHIEQVEGETFRWGGLYNQDFSHRDTLFTELGVFSDFKPKVSSIDVKRPLVFLANIQPSLQLDVISQLPNSSLIVLDTMNLWIDNNFNELIEVIKKSDILLINDEEIIQLTNNKNLEQGALKLLEFGLQYVIIKKGRDGSLIINKDLVISIPAFPVSEVVDPTGAGDSFAGGFIGTLTSTDINSIKNAVVHGTAVASFTISKFGIEGILNLEYKNIIKRVKLLNQLLEGI